MYELHTVVAVCHEPFLSWNPPPQLAILQIPPSVASKHLVCSNECYQRCYAELTCGGLAEGTLKGAVDARHSAIRRYPPWGRVRLWRSSVRAG